MTNKEKNFISAVIYVHNDEKNIGSFLQIVMNILEEHFEHSEIICVNDYSQDSSVEIVRRISSEAETTTVTVLNMSYFHGVEVAMNAGMDLAIGDFVLEFDSCVPDFAPQEIMRVYKKALEGYDIVSASPDKKQRFTSNIFYSVFNRFTDFSYKLYTERFRVLSRRVINRISSMNKSVPYRKAVYANCGLKTMNLRYPTVGGCLDKEDKTERKYRADLAVDSMILFTEVGYRFSVTMTVLMMLVAIFVAVYSAVIYLFSTPVAGWTTTIFFMSFAFFGLFGILTIIIKYLQILVDLVFRRKKYSFESIEKITK
ncbi:MAG: glycosyltransferase [Lachnospiraceae bacterium]|nr:glycosyltransferase [Lachnospiraceae bacterium]MBO5143954.1 glycosyltransferase [Lachnospiraceae bacterium]